MRKPGPGWWVFWAWALSLGYFGPMFWAWSGGPPAILSLSVACATGLGMLWYRMQAHDRFAETPRIVRQKPREPKPAVRPMIVTQGGSTIRLGRFTLPYEGAEALAVNVLRKSRFVRDVIPPGLFHSLTRRWPDILSEFQRLGLVDDRQDITPAGREWFMKFTSPTLHARLVDRGDDQTTTTTTADQAQAWLDDRGRFRR